MTAPAADQVTAPRALPGGRLATLLLSDDPRQRRRITMVLMTAMMYTVCLALLGYGVAFSIFDPARVALLGLLCTLTAAVFYTLVRSGLNLRFLQPSLAFPQALTAQTLIAFAYAVSGPAHAANLIFLAMVMFFGMFDMGMRKVRLLMFYTIFLMGGVMAWCAWRDPAVYRPELELIYFAMMATVLPAISTLALQLSIMRDRLRRQKEELASALAHIRKIATNDELTGLPNRRRMLELLAEHIVRQARGGPAFHVALADIDHFKKVNDTYGHRVGDEALVLFARQARTLLRSTDVVGRWGGEEFLMLLPAAPPGDPNLGIERLRAGLAQTQVSGAAPELRIAFSTGLTTYQDGEAVDDMIERADGALYAAKHAGRNRTVRG